MNFKTTQKLNKQNKKRIEILDALRGLSVVLMVIHHFFYDLVEFLSAPAWLFSNPVFDFLHLFFAGTFVVISGISSNFSKSNIKRGFLCLVFALAITCVTVIIEMPVIFGILHLLSFCMIFYGITERLWNKIPKPIMPVICIAGFFISSYCVNNIEIQSKSLWMFGWKYHGFVSFDYFPVFPWIFIFLFGTWAGFYIKENRFPKWFYNTKIPILPTVGRHALITYLAHQPVLYLITVFLQKINYHI